jgi:hypothetical protein
MHALLIAVKTIDLPFLPPWFVCVLKGQPVDQHRAEDGVHLSDSAANAAAAAQRSATHSSSSSAATHSVRASVFVVGALNSLSRY